MTNWIPGIEIENARRIRQVSLKTYHLMKGRIYITGDINAETAENFFDQMLYMEDTRKKATLIIDSDGGEIGAGLMIYDTLVNAKVPVDVCCVGKACSMAAILLAAGEKGHRFILPHSKVMIHEPRILGGLGGTASSIRSISDSILETRDTVNGILAKHTRKSLEEINRCTVYDNFMTAEQAIAFGICDKIVKHI